MQYSNLLVKISQIIIKSEFELLQVNSEIEKTTESLDYYWINWCKGAHSSSWKICWRDQPCRLHLYYVSVGVSRSSSQVSRNISELSMGFHLGPLTARVPRSAKAYLYSLSRFRCHNYYRIARVIMLIFSKFNYGIDFIPWVFGRTPYIINKHQRFWCETFNAAS